MTSATHHAAPEDIMAFLDGELSSPEAQSVSAHLETCPECAALAAGLRATSQSLARWETPPIPAKLEESIMEATLIAGVQNRSAWPLPLLRPHGRRWKPWLLGAGGAIALLALSAVLVLQRGSQKKAVAYLPPPSSALMMSEQMGRSVKTERFSGGGLEQLGKGPDFDKNESKQFDRLDRAAKLMAPPAVKYPASLGGRPAADQLAATTSPMIARTANLTILVKDVDSSRPSLDAILTRHRGYPAQLDVNTPSNSPHSIQASLRIPAPELPAALADLKTLGRVQNESQSGEEVTQQHEDLEARLKTARETETRFQSILQQRTGTIADVLEVQQSIAEVRGEIEQMETQQQALEHRVDFATIELNLTEDYKASLASPGDSTATQMHNAFVTGFHNATGTILGIVFFLEEYGPAILIWLAILAALIIPVRRRYRRLHRSL